MPLLTALMYHYVRPLERTRFPSIKGLDVAHFEEQVGYIQKHYNIVSVENLVDAIASKVKLPANPALLTFDDGLIDHYAYVFPVLAERGLAGAFFPPAKAVLNRRLLEVHKIHFILASGCEPDALALEIDRVCRERSVEWKLDTVENYRRSYWIENRFDPASVVYVKRMLQHALPSELRSQIVASLFAKAVTADEVAFAEELYVSEAQLKVMVSMGMHVGSHGDAHPWLSRLSAEAQEKDIVGSLSLLRAVGADPDYFTCCYPYGDYDESTIEILKRNGFKVAFTSAAMIAEVGSDTCFTLARLDTNDLPKRADAPPNYWTLLGRGEAK